MKVLIVDDDEAILEAIGLIIEQLGHKTFKLISSKGLDNVLDNKKPDLVFLDIMLNGESGWTILKNLKKSPNYSSIPVIVFSAASNAKSVWKENGADGFLAKPFAIKQLQEVIENFKN